MWPKGYFAVRYWAPPYWAPVVVVPPSPGPKGMVGGGYGQTSASSGSYKMVRGYYEANRRKRKFTIYLPEYAESKHITVRAEEQHHPEPAKAKTLPVRIGTLNIKIVQDFTEGAKKRKKLLAMLRRLDRMITGEDEELSMMFPGDPIEVLAIVEEYLVSRN